MNPSSTPVRPPVASSAPSTGGEVPDRTGPTHVTNTTREVSTAWYPVALAEELTDEAPLAVELLGSWWALARLDGELVAFVDECPHRLFPLSAGTLCGSTIRCGYHGWSFAADGSCTDIPSSGAGASIPARARLRRPAGVQERYGLIWLAPEEPVCDLPDLEEFESDAFEVRHDEPARTNAGFAQCVDNFVDTSHFLMVHAGTFGGDPAAQAQPETVERDGWVVAADYVTPYQVLDDPAVAAGSLPQEQVSPQRKLYSPGSFMALRMEFPLTESVFSILIAVQPEHDGSSRIYRVWARNDIADDEQRWDEHRKVERLVLEEDLDAFARFRDGSVPLDVRREVHVAADKLSVAFRRVLAELVAHGTATLDADG